MVLDEKAKQWPLNLSNYLLVFELLGFIFTSFALVIRAEKSFKERTLPCSSTALVIVTCNYQTYITRNMVQDRNGQILSLTEHLFYSNNMTFHTSYNVGNSGLNACKVRGRTAWGFVPESIPWKLNFQIRKEKSPSRWHLNAIEILSYPCRNCLHSAPPAWQHSAAVESIHSSSHLIPLWSWQQRAQSKQSIFIPVVPLCLISC